MGEQDSGGIAREYRRTRRMPPPTLLLMAAGVLVGANSVYAMTESGASLWNGLSLAAWMVVVGRGALEEWRAHTSVTADGVTVRGALRTRTWPWSDVYGIRVEDNRHGFPRWSGYLYAVDGRRTRLPQVDEYHLPDPIGEIADLYATALRLGLTSPEPRPEVEKRIERETRRRKAWQRAAVVGAVVAVAMFVLDGWLLFTDRPSNTFLLVLCVPLLCLPLAFLALDRVGEARAARAS
ncbi:PH domain-containing protein [Streptomyces neyagawaensis]|uniref:PH domain-containing protein n=1 Tax=Streptomyces neyagawaensis TaxID=42238 RepID=A0ABV3AZF1_9ACTN